MSQHSSLQDIFKIYFLTERRFYELAYRWVNTLDEIGQMKPKDEWEVQIVGTLKALPFRGGELMGMIKQLDMAQAIVVALSFPQGEDEGESTAICIEVSAGELPFPLAFIVPIAVETSARAEDGEGADQFTGDVNDRITRQSSRAVSVRDERSTQRYNVVEVSVPRSRGVNVVTNVPYKQAFAYATAMEQEMGVLIFRYHADIQIPPGKKRDSLEWLNSFVTRTQEPFGFFFRGLYFETTNSVEIQSEQGLERIPAELYVATAFQVEREEGVRNMNIYRPFGRRSDAIEWLNSIVYTKASLTRLIPDAGSTNWFVLSDRQNLNPLGFRQQGDAEWL